MAGRKEFELLFKLKATLGGNFNSSFTNAMNTTRQLQNTLSKINTTQGKIDGYKKQAQAITENKSKLAELTAEHDRLQQEMNQTENPSEALRKKFERNARQIEQTTAKIEEQEARLDTLGGELRDAGVDTDRLSEENDRLSQSYDRVRQSQEKLAKIADAQKKNDEAIAKTKSQLGGTIGVITAVGAAIYAGPVKNSIEFQTAMAKVGTIADSSVVPLSTMQKEVLKLSSTVGVSADLIADDVYNAISAGQSTENAVGFVEKAVKLAKGGFAETGQALDVLTTIINAYGLESEDAAKISDMLIQTQNKGKTTVAELSSVMGKIIPTAKSNNVALEQVCAGYAIMTSKGIAAAETTTYMNSMLNELGKTGTKADKALKQAAGAGFKDLMASGKSIAEVLDILDGAAQKSGLSLSDMFGSAEAGKAALTLMAGGVDGFNESVDGMLNSTGAAQSAFEKMADTTQNKIDKAKTALKNLSIVLGDTFLPYVTAGAEKLSDLVTKFSDWAMENPELLKTIVKVVAGLAAFRVGSLGAKLGFLQLKGGVLDVMAAFTKFKALGGIKGIFGKAGGGIGKLFSGIGGKLLPIVAIATAIAVAIKLISGNLEEVRGFIQRTFGDTGLAIFDKVVSVVQNIGNAIKGVFSGENISGARDFFQNTFGDAGVAVFDAVIGVVEQLKAILPGLIDQLSQGVAAILPVIVDLFKQLLPVVMNIVATVLPMVIQAIGQLLPLVMEVINTVLPVLIQLIQTLAPVISEIIQAVLPVIIQLLQTLLPIVQEIINTVLPIIIDLFNTFMPIIQQLIQTVLPILTQLLQALVPVIQFVAELFGNVLGSALQSVSAIVDNVKQVFQGLIDFITGVFTGNWSKAWEGVKGIFSGVAGGLGNIFKGSINAIISAINTFLGGLNKIKIPDWVPGVGGKGFNIPKIPMLAKGSNYTPDTFIAGEAGAELVTNAKGRKVFTAAQTGDIFKNLEAARSAQVQQVIITLAPALQAMLASAGAAAAGGAAMPVQQIYSARTAPGVTAPTVAAETGTRTTTLTLQSNPVFNVNGGDPEELRGMFDEYQQDTLNKVDEMWRKKEDDERRGRYD